MRPVRRVLFSALIALAAIPTPFARAQTPAAPAAPIAPADAIAPAHPTRHRLANGLDVVLLEDHRTPRIAVLTTYRVGGRDQPTGYRGIAHLLEHVMYEGSRHAPGHTYDTLLDQAGGTDVNAGTLSDYTEYRLVVPSNQLGLALWLESDRMAYLLDRLDARSIDAQRRVVLAEYRERTPEPIVEWHLARTLQALYPTGHPYRDRLDRPADLNQLRLPDVQWFFQHYYNPNNATLVLVGDFDSHEALRQVRHYFHGLVNAGEPRVVPPVPLPEPHSERRVVTMAATRVDLLTVAWIVPRAFTTESAQLDMVASVLDRRLSRSMIFDRGIATGVDVANSSRQLSSEFAIDVQVAENSSVDTAIAAVDEAMDRLSRDPVSDNELNRARNGNVRSLLFSTDNLLTHAQILRDATLTMDNPDYLDGELTRYREASADDLLRVTRRFLTRNRRVLSIVRRTGRVRQDLLVQGPTVRAPAALLEPALPPRAFFSLWP